jgi:dTDP-glucose pyrophosphorylase
VLKLEKHIINQQDSIKSVLELLTDLGSNLTLFVVDDDKKLIGVITDGDIRRGLLKNVHLTQSVCDVMNTNFCFLVENQVSIEKLNEYRKLGILLIPIVSQSNEIIKIINLSELKSFIPVDAVLMAGGKGERLLPLTKETPKPLLEVGGKSIIQRNIELLTSYGITNLILSVNYLANKIIDKIGNGGDDIKISYIIEDKPLGTLGALSLTKNYQHETVVIMNADILTNINFEDFYKYFVLEKADMAIATMSYKVNIPYAVLETHENNIKSFKEKPTYTYFSNAGIYLIKRELINVIPVNEYYNATDLITKLLDLNKKVISYPILGYWLDIGRHEDFEKAQIDINHITF